MGSLRNDRRNRCLSLAAGVSLALATASALADAPKPATITQPSELMTFANVKVINATEVTPATQKQSGTQQGLRVNVDGDTKRIRAQTREDAQEIADESKAKLAAKTAARSRSRSASLSGDEPAASEPQTFYGPGNAIGLEVGDDVSVYQVVRKDGKRLITSEFNGKDAAEKSLKAKVSPTEVNHDR